MLKRIKHRRDAKRVASHMQAAYMWRPVPRSPLIEE